MNHRSKAFTLVELLVVIAIIGLLASISIIALNSARAKARDAKRVADVKQISTAIELFFNTEGRYPTEAEYEAGTIATGSTVFLARIPSPPLPNDGDCLAGTSTYYGYRVKPDGSGFSVGYCLGSRVSDLPAGDHTDSEVAISGISCNDSVFYRGKFYRTILIGNQCWFRDNLNVGEMVAGTVQQTNNDTIEKYCYGDSEANCTTYGALYQWDEAMGYSTVAGVQGICPSGWHIPTDAEQNILDQYLVDSPNTCNASRTSFGCGNAGTKLQTGGSSGFDALITGFRDSNGLFSDPDYGMIFWSSSMSGVNAWYRSLYTGSSEVFRATLARVIGVSVRCLKN
ncbi:MAG TPA: FISUMP domain-containing protein [bacterium]|nr:FISUMP domain-containing protein [bacterium]HPT29788.1 FISUMP domain-containing protein [bacterium]